VTDASPLTGSSTDSPDSPGAETAPATPTRTIAVGSSFRLTTPADTWAFFRMRPADLGTRDSRFTVRTPAGSPRSAHLMAQILVDITAGGPGAQQFVERVELPAGDSVISYSTLVDVPDRPDPMPDHAVGPPLRDFTPENWWWIQPTRYCRPDELGQEAWSLFGGGVSAGQPATGLTVRAICTHVNEQMFFQYGSSTSLTTATDAWFQRRGVCRDFNHIAVSFCRALNIPTRYVFGYIPEIDIEPTGAEPDFCAWFEVFLDGRWFAFDARVNRPRIGRIVVGRGRDAADVPVMSTMGAAVLSEFMVSATEIR
jgi:transglutaminase-like putative cysteine protease